MPSSIMGEVTAWDEAKGSLKTDAGKEYNFSKDDLAQLRFSGPYKPKVGDKIIGNPKQGDDGGLNGIMEFV